MACGRRFTGPKRYSTVVIIRACTSSPLIPSVVATCPSTSRSQQSRANATRTFSPLSQPISNPSEHQRRLDCSTATRPTCQRASAPPAWSYSSRPLALMIR
jgi:hypothetical protein